MIVKLIVLVPVFTALAIPIHELGHLIALRILGNDGHLRFDVLGTLHVAWLAEC